jgi:TRAP-type C4-dicarboxylate transport system permease large subunit
LIYRLNPVRVLGRLSNQYIKVRPATLVTPPVGLNLYIVKNIAPDVPMSHVLIGVIPFVIIELLVIVCVCIWPELALWLPNKMIG